MTTQLDIIDEQTVSEKLSTVKDLLENKRIIVAYSGGVDSTVVAHLSKLYGKEVKLVMQIGVSVGIGEKEIAKEQAEQLGLPIQFIEYAEVDYSDRYARNPSDRCYYCKDLLFGFLDEIKSEHNFDLVVSGTNASDLKGHRPGHQAAKEAGVIDPLAEADIRKMEVRHIAKDASLKVWDKPATACLASRFITGVEITKSRLNRVARAEHYIKQNYDINILRVRDHGGLARIEVGSSEMNQVMDEKIFQDIHDKLIELGFDYVSFDMKGYRQSTPK